MGRIICCVRDWSTVEAVHLVLRVRQEAAQRQHLLVQFLPQVKALFLGFIMEEMVEIWELLANLHILKVVLVELFTRVVLRVKLLLVMPLAGIK